MSNHRGGAQHYGSHLLGELLAHQRQDQRRLPHLGCAGKHGQHGSQGRGAPVPDKTGPDPRPRPGCLPSPSSRMRTSLFMAAAGSYSPTPAHSRSEPSSSPDPSPGPDPSPRLVLLPTLAQNPHFRPPPRSRTSEPGGPERPAAKRRRRVSSPGTAGAAPTGRGALAGGQARAVWGLDRGLA